MPTKDLASFSYISPQKNLFSTIKYELTTGVSNSCQQMGKKSENGKTAPPTNPAAAPPQKFDALDNIYIGGLNRAYFYYYYYYYYRTKVQIKCIQLNKNKNILLHMQNKQCSIQYLSLIHISEPTRPY